MLKVQITREVGVMVARADLVIEVVAVLFGSHVTNNFTSALVTEVGREKKDTSGDKTFPSLKRETHPTRDPSSGHDPIRS